MMILSGPLRGVTIIIFFYFPQLRS